MSRPRRLASQKVFEQQKLDLSELEDESDEDFSSQSSDDYDPNKSKSNNIEETIQESSSDVSGHNETSEDEESFTIETKKSNVKRASQKSRNNRSIIATLRKEAVSKFANRSSSSSKQLQDILKKAQYEKKKSLFSESEDENEKIPNFDCSGGLKLSDSSENSCDEDTNIRKVKKTYSKRNLDVASSIVNEESTSSTMDLKAIHDNLERIRKAKEKLSNYAADNSTEADTANDNIASLLALGENTKKHGLSQKRSNKALQPDDSDSDNWEEVEDDDPKAYRGPKESVEILLNHFGGQDKKKDTKSVDVEAQLKRKFNRKRKEHQEHLHKTELMCWLTHCNYVNKRLNNPTLMDCALKMLPSTKNKNQCYPKDKTDIDYFNQITKWFKQTIVLRNSRMYCTQLKKKPPLLLSLALQMKYKTAICRRDYILMFVTLLRAIGIQCRIVQSLVMDPKICPKSELMSLSKKALNKINDDTSTVRSSKSSSKTSSKKSKKSPKLDQLDGVNDEKLKGGSKTRKGIKIKLSSENKVDESYIDLSKMQTLPPKVKIDSNSPNVEKVSLTEKLKKSSKSVKKMIISDSPRKTRSASRDLSPKPSTSNGTKKSETPKKASLKVSPPKRMRTRSRSKNLQDEEKKEDSEAGKPNLKSLSQKKASVKLAESKPKDTLKVFSPRRLRSRSRSTEADSNKSTSDKVTSRKRVPPIPEEIQIKKAKLTTSNRNLRKRGAPTEENLSLSKKPRKSDTKKQAKDEGDDHSDESLKYFKNISSSLKKSTSKSSAAKKPKEPKPSTSTAIDRRILSSDDEGAVEANMQSMSPKKSKGIDVWVEVYSERDDKWLSIDIFRGRVDCVKEICQKATHPLLYVFAWNNNQSVKDVSARYVANLNTTVRKMRVERDYLNSIMKIFNVKNVRTTRDLKEDEELNKVQFDVPMPKSIAEFKNHPLYVLKRHLLKYEAIYPPEPPILGYIRDEAIYPRDCCFNLHSRETWLKEAKQVKLNEQPYKIVRTMRWDRAQNKMHKDIPLELFGIWQVKDFEPPVAENGVVPRNAYGNVELFKACMLPIGTVHLQLPGLNRICKKIGVDCAQAIVGFDSNGNWPFPVYDGFVVCKEFEQKVIDAWTKEQDEAERKEQEKYEKRVYGNWKKLIKGLLIRERLMQKYNNFEDHK